MVNLTRRGFIIGAASLLAAPAIVRIENIMPLFVMKPPARSIQTLFDEYVDKLANPPLVAGLDGQWVLYRFSAAQVFEINWKEDIVAEDWAPQIIHDKQWERDGFGQLRNPRKGFRA